MENSLKGFNPHLPLSKVNARIDSNSKDESRNLHYIINNSQDPTIKIIKLSFHNRNGKLRNKVVVMNTIKRITQGKLFVCDCYGTIRHLYERDGNYLFLKSTDSNVNYYVKCVSFPKLELPEWIEIFFSSLPW